MCSIAAVLSVVVVSNALPASAASLVSFHLIVTGVAEVSVSTCPWTEEPPPIGVECVDTFILYAQEGSPTDQVRTLPWHLVVFENHYVYRGDGLFEDLSQRFGVLEDPSGSVDTRHLLSATVHGTVPMDDGSSYSVDLRWDMAGTSFNVAGMNGPIQEEGVPWGSHIVDRCLTQNWLAHQTWRAKGQVAGTVDGQDVSSLLIAPLEPFVGRGIFTVTIAGHASCA